MTNSSVKARTMTQWEYKFVVCNFHADFWRPESVNGKKLENWKKGPTMTEYSNQAGSEGWEMVGFAMQHVQVISTDRIRLVFKRPVG